MWVADLAEEEVAAEGAVAAAAQEGKPLWCLEVTAAGEVAAVDPEGPAGVAQAG